MGVFRYPFLPGLGGKIFFYISAMAIPISSIPALKGKEALAFVEAAESNGKKGRSVDFSDKIRIANNILRKAKI
jgi:hypothetical protein